MRGGGSRGDDSIERPGGGGCSRPVGECLAEGTRQKRGRRLRQKLEGSGGEERGETGGRQEGDRRGETGFRVAVKATEALQEFGNQ